MYGYPMYGNPLMQYANLGPYLPPPTPEPEEPDCESEKYYGTGISTIEGARKRFRELQSRPTLLPKEDRKHIYPCFKKLTTKIKEDDKINNEVGAVYSLQGRRRRSRRRSRRSRSRRSKRSRRLRRRH